MDFEAFNVDPDLFVKGPSTSDIEMITTPYEKCENAKLIRGKVKSLKSQYSDYFKCRKHHREIRLRRAAAVNNTENILQILKDYDVNVNAADEQGRTALHIAASRGYRDAVKCLVQSGADVNVEDKLGNTPMHLAVYTGSTETVFALIRGGAHLRKTQLLPYTPLQLAESKYAMMKNHDSVNGHWKDTLEIINILRLVNDSKSIKWQDLDELSSKVSQIKIEQPNNL